MESEIAFTGLVTHVRPWHGGGESSITDGNVTYIVQTGKFESGSVVRVKGVLSDPLKLAVLPREVRVLDGDERVEAVLAIEKAAEGGVKLVAAEPLCRDEVAVRMVGGIAGMARRLMVAMRLGRSVLLRFHHDADGIAGALALTSFLRCRAFQQNSASYSAKDAIRDMGAVHGENGPVVVLLDFGSNKESAEGIRLLKAAGISVMVIDHHPPDMDTIGLADAAVSPWLVTDDAGASRYTAGYLASEIARACGSDAGVFAGIACAGDKSGILGESEDCRKKALVLDYLAANSSFGNNLDFYKSVLGNPELFHSLWIQADEKIGEAASAAMRGAKARKGGWAEAYVFDLDRVVVEGEFPNRSKVATRLFEILDKEHGGKPLVVLGRGRKTVIMRANAAAAERVDLGAVAGMIQESMRGFVVSGGGHRCAAAIRVREGYSKTVVEAILDRMEKGTGG